MRRATGGRYYQLRPERRRLGVDLDARHKWALPGVSCEVCGETWAVTGLDYPTIDLSSFPGQRALSGGGVVSTEEYAQLSERLENILQGRLHLPGTELGPLVGVGAGKPSDFVWLNPWTLLIEERAMALLRDQRLRLPEAVPAVLRELNGRLFELELLPHGEVRGVPRGKPCPGCGRTALRLTGRPMIRRLSLGEHPDLFRISNFSTLLIGTESFVSCMKTLKLGGCSVTPVDVS